MVINYVTELSRAMASVRYRMTIPAAHMSCDSYLGPYPMLDCNIHVFGKPLVNDVHWARQCKEYDRIVVWDCCDNHFRDKADKDVKEAYLAMFEMADVITCPTENMAKVIRDMGKEAHVIADPWGYDEVAPKPIEWGDTSETRPKLMMFGNIASMNSMRRVVDELVKAGMEYKALIIGDTRYPWPEMPINQWSPKMMMEGFKASDIVVIPVESGDRSDVKSPNRMVDSIRQGKFVIAEPMPEYEQFSEWMYVGNITEGLKWAEKHKAELPELVRLAQLHVRNLYDPVAIGRQWENLYGSILGAGLNCFQDSSTAT